MTDVNDLQMNYGQAVPTYTPGKWYGWTGGECPVPRDMMVEVLLGNGSRMIRTAGRFAWTGGRGYNIVAFRPSEDWRTEIGERLYDADGEKTDQWGRSNG